MKQLEGKWPDKVLTMQRNWIGKSTGAEIKFQIEDRAEPVVSIRRGLTRFMVQHLWLWQ